MPLLQLRGIRKSFVNRGSPVHAVRDVSLHVPESRIVGLVGESGSGKSTVANLVLGLERPDAGEILFRGRPLEGWLSGSGRPYRAQVQAVFQDPVQAMDSRKRIGWSVAEPLVVHGVARGESARARVADLLDAVHLDPVLADRYPHQVSGGQAQRANIARALALRPSLLVCDEAVSALDVSVQAQIMNLFLEIQELSGTAMLFISHALPVVRHLSDSIVVMYAGTVVEQGPADVVCERPWHPYTRLLVSSVPRPRPEGAAHRPVAAAREELPTSGCRFAPRCPLVIDRCRQEEPRLREVDVAHRAACWRAGETVPGGSR